jgi:(p)ppGpp synthase/HD superfamily hydrolase
MGSQLDDEIESWKGFPWALRREDRELWDEMIEEVRQYHAEAVELSGKPLMTDPFFMALLLAQQRTIERLRAKLRETQGLVG